MERSQAAGDAEREADQSSSEDMLEEHDRVDARPVCIPDEDHPTAQDAEALRRADEASNFDRLRRRLQELLDHGLLPKALVSLMCSHIPLEGSPNTMLRHLMDRLDKVQSSVSSGGAFSRAARQLHSLIGPGLNDVRPGDLVLSQFATLYRDFPQLIDAICDGERVLSAVERFVTPTPHQLRKALGKVRASIARLEGSVTEGWRRREADATRLHHTQMAGAEGLTVAHDNAGLTLALQLRRLLACVQDARPQGCEEVQRLAADVEREMLAFLIPSLARFEGEWPFGLAKNPEPGRSADLYHQRHKFYPVLLLYSLHSLGFVIGEARLIVLSQQTLTRLQGRGPQGQAEDLDEVAEIRPWTAVLLPPGEGPPESEVPLEAERSRLEVKPSGDCRLVCFGGELRFARVAQVLAHRSVCHGRTKTSTKRKNPSQENEPDMPANANAVPERFVVAVSLQRTEREPRGAQWLLLPHPAPFFLASHDSQCLSVSFVAAAFLGALGAHQLTSEATLAPGRLREALRQCLDGVARRRAYADRAHRGGMQDEEALLRELQWRMEPVWTKLDDLLWSSGALPQAEDVAFLNVVPKTGDVKKEWRELYTAAEAAGKAAAEAAARAPRRSRENSRDSRHFGRLDTLQPSIAPLSLTLNQTAELVHGLQIEG